MASGPAKRLPPEEEAEEDRFLESFKRPEGAPRPSWALPDEGFLEAMEHVPLFMTASPGSVDDNPTLAALQSLLYDGSDPNEIAQNFLENAQELIVAMKNNPTHKHVSTQQQNAFGFLKNALEQKPTDSTLLARIHASIAWLHLQKQNYGKSRDASLTALQCDRGHVAAKEVLFKAYLALGQHALALPVGEALATDMPATYGAEVEQLRATMAAALAKAQQKQAEERAFQQLLLSRRLGNLVPGDQTGREALALLGSHLPGNLLHDLPKAKMSSAGELVLPAVFLYPRYQTYDVIGGMGETTCVLDHLDMMFQEAAPWDTHSLYTPSRVPKMRAYLPAFSQQKPFHLTAFSETDPLRVAFQRTPTTLLQGVLVLVILPEAQHSPGSSYHGFHIL